MNHQPISSALLRRLVLPLLACVGLVATGCATDQQVIAQAANVHQQLEPTVVTAAEAPELSAYVQAVGDRIVEAARLAHEQGLYDEAEPWMFEDIQFHLVASPTLNAFTTGGKHVYLYSQLFEESDTEDAFAAVVGHEFGHILGRHVHESMNNQYLVLGGAGVAAALGAALSEDGSRLETASTVGGLAMAGGQIVGLSFGRGNEREADEIGFEIYVRAGYDPAQFSDFFRNMIEQGYDTGGGIEGFLSSHPRLAERVQSAEQWAEQVPPEVVAQYDQPPIASEREFAALKQRSQQFTARAKQQAQQPGSTAYKQALALLAAFPACVGGPADGVPPEENAINQPSEIDNRERVSMPAE